MSIAPTMPHRISISTGEKPLGAPPEDCYSPGMPSRLQSPLGQLEDSDLLSRREWVEPIENAARTALIASAPQTRGGMP